MPQLNDLSRSLVALDQDSTIIAVVEMSQSSWLVAGMLPGIERQPRKKLEPSPERLLGLLHRWRDEAIKAGRKITRIALAFEAGRDGFWLARWLDVRGVEAHVIHPSSVAVSREHRRAKTDRLDTELLKRGFLGWLRGERGHCSALEDAHRTIQQLLLPVVDLVRVDPEMHRQLGDGPVALDRRQRYLSLESRTVLLPCPLHVLLPRYPRFLGAGLHLIHLSHFRGPPQRPSRITSAPLTAPAFPSSTGPGAPVPLSHSRSVPSSDHDRMRPSRS